MLSNGQTENKAANKVLDKLKLESEGTPQKHNKSSYNTNEQIRAAIFCMKIGNANQFFTPYLNAIKDVNHVFRSKKVTNKEFSGLALLHIAVLFRDVNLLKALKKRPDLSADTKVKEEVTIPAEGKIKAVNLSEGLNALGVFESTIDKDNKEKEIKFFEELNGLYVGKSKKTNKSEKNITEAINGIEAALGVAEIEVLGESKETSQSNNGEEMTKVKELEAKIAKLTQQLNEQEEQHKAELEKQQKEYDALDTQHEAKKGQIADLSKKLGETREKLQASENRIEALEAAVEAAKAELPEGAVSKDAHETAVKAAKEEGAKSVLEKLTDKSFVRHKDTDKEVVIETGNVRSEVEKTKDGFVAALFTEAVLNKREQAAYDQGKTKGIEEGKKKAKKESKKEPVAKTWKESVKEKFEGFKDSAKARLSHLLNMVSFGKKGEKLGDDKFYARETKTAYGLVLAATTLCATYKFKPEVFTSAFQAMANNRAADFISKNGGSKAMELAGQGYSIAAKHLASAKDSAMNYIGRG